jgi:hypothetical protein
VRRLVLALAVMSATLSGGCAQGCPTALLTGVLAEDAGELVVVDDGGEARRVTWPGGHSVRADGDTLVLTNTLGGVVAREGDTVRLGGGQDAARPDAFKVCGPVEVTG